MKAKNRNNRSMLLGFIVLVALSIAAFTIYSQLKHRTQINSQLQQELQILKENNELVSSLNQLKKALEKSVDEVLVYGRLMPEKPDENSLITYLEEASNEANVEFVKISFDPLAPKEGYVEMPVKLSFSGDYAGMVELLKNMESSKRLLCIDNMSIKRDDADGGKILMEISARAFFIGQKDLQK